MRTRTSTALTTIAITLAAMTATLATAIRTRYQAEAPDRGSVTLEKAILTAVVSALAIALGVIITTAVANHQAKIK